MKKRILYGVIILFIVYLVIHLIFVFPKTQLLTIDKDGVTVFDNEKLENSLIGSEQGELFESEIKGMQFMIEEEKLARDVCLILYNAWEIKTFKNIADAEETHMNAVKSLINFYGVENPMIDEIGKFDNKKLQKLNDDLVEKGSSSEIDAFIVGAAIEEIDILDLEEYLKETSNKKIILVYNNLLRGSRNHLRAFVKQIESRGEVYTPQYLEVEAYEDIIESKVERGFISKI